MARINRAFIYTIIIATIICSHRVYARETIMPASVVSESEQKIQGKTYFVHKVRIDASPKVIWNILVDYPNISEIFSEVTDCRVLAEGSNTKTVFMEVKPLPPFPLYKYTIQTKETYPQSIEWQCVSGDFKTNQGAFTFEPQNNGKSTLVTFSKCIEMNLPFSQFIIKHNLTTFMPKNLRALKAKAEGAPVETISAK